MNVINQLKEQAAQDMERAKSFQAAIAALENAVNDLGRHGYQAGLTHANSGLVCLSVDFSNFALAKSVPSPFPAAPVPKPPAARRGKTRANKPARIEAKTENATTPLLGRDRAFAIELLAKGRSPSDIARQMGRKTKQISNLKARCKGEIADCAARASGRSMPKPPAPVAANPVSQVPMDQQDAMSAAERTINAHLNGLGYVNPWSPERDLELVEGMISGKSVDMVAAALKISRTYIIGRWKALNTDIGALDHQVRLMRVLKLRAGDAAASMVAE